MLGLYVTVPIASFRRGAAREYWETLPLPPPSTVYGFLLALVGEIDRDRYQGVRCTAGLIGRPEQSSVLRKLWRIKDKKLDPGTQTNLRPDFQQLLTDVRLLIWLHSAGDSSEPESLERRVEFAMSKQNRGQLNRFGGLSLGESTHLVDEVLSSEQWAAEHDEAVNLFLVDEEGDLTLPVWVDHVGSAGTRYALGRLVETNAHPPAAETMPLISAQ